MEIMTMPNDECFYCGAVLPWDRPDNGCSEYCGDDCLDAQGRADRE